jgi:hypothetical protein
MSYGPKASSASEIPFDCRIASLERWSYRWAGGNWRKLLDLGNGHYRGIISRGIIAATFVVSFLCR